GDCVRIGDLVAAAHAELDVLPLGTAVRERGLDGVGAHLHRRLAVEPPERVETDANDCDLFHLEPRFDQTGSKAKVSTSVPSSSVYNGTIVSSTSIPNSSFSGSSSVNRPSTRMTSSSWIRPMPNGLNDSMVSRPA